MSKIAVVFGGSGFIGSLIVSRLALAGYVVRVPTRALARAEPLRQLGAPGQVTPLLVDVHDMAAVADVVQDANVVVNCIGILAEGKGARFDDVQGELPGLIARAAAHADVKHLVHLSAIGADANSASRYARSKAAGEGMIRALFPRGVILRPSVVFGAQDNFFNRFARMAMISPALPLVGGGKTRMQPVFVGDVANAVMAAITRPDAAGKTFELGGPAIYTFKGLLQLMLRTIGRQRLLVPLPWRLAMLKAAVLEKLPGKLLTRDQVVLLQADNVVAHNAKTLVDLGVTPTAAEAILPTYLDRYRPRGRFR